MKKAGLGDNLRFKPGTESSLADGMSNFTDSHSAYNPYTEPSAEVFSYHAGLGKWIEVGNVSVFRRREP